MSNPIVEALAQLKQELNANAHASYTAPKKEPFDHGMEVGTCHGLLRALAILQNVLSADDEADAQL